LDFLVEHSSIAFGLLLPFSQKRPTEVVKVTIHLHPQVFLKKIHLVLVGVVHKNNPRVAAGTIELE
jgi:hypothetical protein